MTYVIKNDDTFYTQLFLGEAFYDEKNMATTCEKKIWYKILISGKGLRDFNFEKLKTQLYIQNNLIHSDSNMYLAVDSLIDINNIITGSNKNTLRNVNVKPNECDKT